MFSRVYGSHMAHLVWLSQEQACHAWLFLVKNGPGLGHFLPFLGVANELNDPKTCFPIHVECRCDMAYQCLSTCFG